ncbi:hypothetical protein BJF85_11790 [Saccharomonospora sp. CUA-673]|uniref:plasmid mobilization protein n=1 Tax=Saccharomonospora sp. CUA-673 TaxID=1904969 RepID=UPI000959626B|nr:hypothetical protein [Saccharomonospora sp. CUA-673]OLT48786.1 hypothetical protein BJF85_11790 [Saccharomonospora sp. CUA-673]
MSDIDKLLAEEGAAAEQFDGQRTRHHATPSRPNLGRSTVVSVRLTAEEHQQLQQAADDARLPLSTLMRLWALDRVQAGDSATPDDAPGSGRNLTVAERLARLEREVFQQTG